MEEALDLSFDRLLMMMMMISLILLPLSPANPDLRTTQIPGSKSHVPLPLLPSYLKIRQKDCVLLGHDTVSQDNLLPTFRK